MNVRADNQFQKQDTVQYQGQHQERDQAQSLASLLKALAAIATLFIGTGFQAARAFAQTPAQAPAQTPAPTIAPTIAQRRQGFTQPVLPIAPIAAPLTELPPANPAAAFDRTLSPIQPNRILAPSLLSPTSNLTQPPQTVQTPFNLVPAQQIPVQQSPVQQTAAPQTPVQQTPEPPQTQPDRLVTAPESTIPNLGGSDDFLPSERTVRLVIVRSERRVYVYENDELKTSYPVAIGKEGWETPLGTWEVIQMIEHPAWEHPFTGEVVPPGTDNPLGARWIGFWTNGKNYIGFHGTPNQASVGQPASHGCVRMYDEDVIALFNLVSLGTTVQVVP